MTPTIILWRFRNPSGLQFPKWEVTWECECSFSDILLHSQPFMSMKCASWASFLARTLASPCFGCEPKAKVMTLWVLHPRYPDRGYLFHRYYQGTLIFTWKYIRFPSSSVSLNKKTSMLPIFYFVLKLKPLFACYHSLSP